VASGSLQLTPRDGQILSFLADHQVVLDRQVAALTGNSAEALAKRLRRLETAGYLRRVQVFEEFCCLIRQPGLRALGSRLRAPKPTLRTYKHDVGLAWLWLAAQRGAFGPVAEVLAERRLRSHDESGVAPHEPYAIRLGGHDADGRERRHYPDLLLVDGRGRRLALELELSRKQISMREKIIAGYGADRRVDGVTYLVESNSEGRAIGRSVEATARRMRLLDRVTVRLITPIRGADFEVPARGRRRDLGRRPSASAEPAR
jgi:hypothetical protein